MGQATRRKIGVRKLTILLLLAAKGADGGERAPIVGATRMQKLVFLAMEASSEFLREDETFQFDFNYSPDRYGPADLDLYQDLELLKAAGWLEVGPKESAPLLPEDYEETEVSFEYLMGEHSEEIDLAEAEREFEREYRITDKGVAKLEQIEKESGKADKFRQLATVCEEITRKYGAWPLNLLLRHVYTTYPETTVKSEIKGRF